MYEHNRGSNIVAGRIVCHRVYDGTHISAGSSRTVGKDIPWVKILRQRSRI